MRKTKIICTLGPSTDKDGVLRELVANGMNVARFNFSHGSYEEHKGRLDNLKAIRAELGNPVVVRLTFPLAVLRAVSVVAETLAGLAGRSSTLNRDKYHIMKQRNWRCDITPLVEELGFRPAYDLQRGVRESIAWYKQQGWL
mgnify:CR=1 FL=1